ncbi:MAG TPA: energy-coupling factor ABC transporter ATP-binding protein [Anaerolineaceae bacterium]|nr:energy-coupling factor ABC transporter ATP-binding protein [Anaerolineaceae bacterium]
MNDVKFQDGLIFEVSDLYYSYDGRRPALEDFHMTVRAGECMAVLGSNGSGKSTLLKILDGLYFAGKGCVRAFGQELTEEAFQDDDFNAAFRRRVGLVFQDSDVQLFLPSVWEEVAFAPLQLSVGREEVLERVESALSTLNIHKLHDRAPHQLSGGEKKRVALASVLSLAPEVWLLDEPSAGLDPRSVRWLTEFMLAQGQASKSIVFATHDLQLVQSVASRACVLDEEHHLLAEGAAADILANEQILLAANLI